MLFGIILHTLSLLGIYSGGVSAAPASLEEGMTPLLDNGAVRPHVPYPHLILQAFANVYADLAESRPISIPEGTRVNVNILGGNWTNTDGSLLATVIPGVGGEQGYIDRNGLFHLDVRYVVQFASDKKFGYVQLKGFGKAGSSNKVTLVVETDSAANLKFNGQFFYSPGVFIGTLLKATIWAFQDLVTK